MKILFISHSYPPILGGVESQNCNLAEALKKNSQVRIIANGRGKAWLPVFLPYAFVKAFFWMSVSDACILGNGVLSPLGYALKLFHPRKRFFCVIHGLDITFAQKDGTLSKIYKSINIPSIKKMDKLFMVGKPTVEAAVEAGVPEEKCVVINNGVNPGDFKEHHTREELSEIFGEDVKNKKVLLRIARFVPHKGTDWFIRNVMPRLPEDVVLIATGYRVGAKTAGDKDNFAECEKAIKESGLNKRVRLLPNLAQEKLKVLLNTADIYISPNIKVPGSMEGFGITVIEAGACERVVVASNLEGLAEAIEDGKNGFLVESGNVEKWTKKIEAILSAGPEFLQEFGKRASAFVEENYTWKKISRRYLEEMEK